MGALLDTVVELLRTAGIALLNGLLLVVYFCWENLLALLQIPLVLVLVRLVEAPQAEVEGYAISGLRPGPANPFSRPRQVLARRTLRLLLVLAAALVTALVFPGTVDVILLLMWLLGGTASALLRMKRADMISRTRTFVLGEVGMLWVLRLAGWAFNLGTISEWAASTGLSPEGAASVLARNAGYVNLALLILALFAVPGGFVTYVWKEFTVLRQSPAFRFATLEEILFDVVGRRQRGIF